MKSQTLRMTLCLAVVGLLMVTGSWALSTGRIQVQVPFSFYAADQLLPAGSYFISAANGGQALRIQRKDGPDYAIVLTLPTSAVKSTLGNYLTFHRYGSDNFLRIIQASDVAISGALWKTDKEKELSATFAKSNAKDKRMAGPVKVNIPLKAD